MAETVLTDANEVRNLRLSVFAEEQGYPESKLFDEHDETAEYLAVRENGEVIGCGRFYKEAENVYHIDNITFSEKMRGRGMGRALVSSLVAHCRERGAEKVTVNAQSYAVPFYEKCGFAVCGCEFSDENRKNIPMVISFEFDGCLYLEADNSADAFYVRKTFECKNAVSAVVRLNVLGFVEPYFNGKKLTDEMYIPAWTNYAKRDLSGALYPIYDTMTQRRYYLEYDVTDILNDGKNVLSLHVGNGWYGTYTTGGGEGMPRWGNKKVIFKLIITMSDGTVKEINSDSTALCKNSYIKTTNIYNNETIDGREYDEAVFAVNYDDSDWTNMTETDSEAVVMCRQNFSGDRFAYSIEPKLLSEDEKGKLYDLCTDVSGLWVVCFDDDAVPGDEARITFAEKIDENGDFLLRHTGGEFRLQQDVYICGENMRQFKPVFTWRAGRYIRVEGKASLVRFDVVYSPVPVVAQLKTENEILDWFFKAYCQTQNCNIHAMIPSDCPHRERLGYTGDGQLCCGAGMTIFDSEVMYRKWMDDIADCQDIYNGHVQHTAPFYGGGGGPGGWGGAMVIVPWTFYKKFGDISVLDKYYVRMKKYLDYMQSRCDDNIVVREEKDGWCLGDWCTLGNNILIPNEFVNTYFYLKCIDYTAKSAEVLGKNEDSEKLSEMFCEIAAAFTAKFYNEKTGSFCDGIQGADAFALDLGLGDERTEENLVKHYTDLGHLDTGIFGTDIVTRVLFEKGYGSLAWQMLTNESEISFGYMKNHGATTLWENWDGCDSLSHPMFGAVSEYIFTYILGIKQCEDSTGFEKVKIEPAYIPESGDISGSVITKNGKISVSVSYADGVRCVRYSADDRITICD